MKLKKQHFSTSNISAIMSPIGLKRQNMFIWFLINTLHYNQMERKNVEILVHLTFNQYVSHLLLRAGSFAKIFFFFLRFPRGCGLQTEERPLSRVEESAE